MSQEIINRLEVIQKAQEKMEKGMQEKFKEVDNKLNEIIQIKTTVYGAQGDKTGGLCGKVAKNSEEIGNLKTIYITLASLLGGIAGWLANVIKI